MAIDFNKFSMDDLKEEFTYPVRREFNPSRPYQQSECE